MNEQVPVAEALGSGLSSVRQTWTAMDEWGKDFERRNFDGDFLKAVRQAPLDAASKVTGGLITDIDHYAGDLLSSWEKAPGEAVAVSFPPLLEEHASASRPCTRQPSTAALLRQVKQLEKDLFLLREARRKQCAEHSAEIEQLVDISDGLRIELTSAQRDMNMATQESNAAAAVLEEVSREFEKLQIACNQLLSSKATLQADLRSERLAEELFQRAEKKAKAEADTSREWARDGPELDALRMAKLELAQVLTDLDEARHRERTELNALHQQLEKELTENAALLHAAEESSRDWLSALTWVH
jgi:hypothetical protein